MAGTSGSVQHESLKGSTPTSWRDFVGLGLVLTFGSMVTVSVPFPGSDSGYLDVYPSEVLAALLGGTLVVLIVTRRWRPGRTCRALILVACVFLGWYLVVSVVRQLTGEEVKQSALALRTTILPLVCYALLDIGWEKPLRVVRSLVVLDLAVSLVHLPAWQNMRMSDYLGNSMVYGAFLVMLIPLNVYVLVTGGEGRGGILLKTVAAANLGLAIVMPVWTGSRSLTALCGLVFAVTALAMVRSARLWGLLAAIVVCAGFVHSIVWQTNPDGAAYGIYRVVPPPPRQASAEAAAESAAQKVVQTEKHKADLNRDVLQDQSVEEIREDPFFTDGRLYFPYENDLGETQAGPHNFVLEHLNAYGAIGFALYLALFGVVLWPGWARLRVGDPGAAENLCAWLTLGTTLGFSLAQPTMMILTITIPLWLVLAAMKRRQAELSAPSQAVAA